VIIGNLDIECVAVIEAKANPPLVIDPDAPLPAAIMTQRFQSVRRRQAQIANLCGCIQLEEPHGGALVDLSRDTARLTARVEVFRLIISERLDHALIINNMFTNVKQLYLRLEAAL